MGNCAASDQKKFKFRLSNEQLAGEFAENEVDFYIEMNALLDRWTHQHV